MAARTETYEIPVRCVMKKTFAVSAHDYHEAVEAALDEARDCDEWQTVEYEDER